MKRSAIEVCAGVLLALALGTSGCAGTSESVAGPGHVGFELDQEDIVFSERDAARDVNFSQQQLVAACFAHRLKDDVKISHRDAIISTRRDSQAAGTLLLGEWLNSESALAAEKAVVAGRRENTADLVDEQGLDVESALEYLEARDAAIESGDVNPDIVLLVVSATTEILRYTYLDTSNDKLSLSPRSSTNFGFQILLAPEDQLVHFDDRECKAFE